MSFKWCLIWRSGDPCVQGSGTIYAILVEGIMGNLHVKLFQIWISGSGGDVFKEKKLQTDRRKPIAIAHLEPSVQAN